MSKLSELKVLQIETTTVCNSNCKFCIHSTLPKFEHMSDDIFLKILKDAKEIPSIELIIPMMLGEPFCDPKIFKRLKLINEILPDKKITLFTNGSLLTPSKIKKLEKINKLTMNFSLNGIDKKTREDSMRIGDFNHVLKMIRLYAKTGKPYKALAIRTKYMSDSDIKKFLALDINTKIIGYRNWSGDKFKECPQTGCTRAISYMTIMYDGIVNLCCMEHGKATFGDVSKKSVKEIWESDYRQMYCSAHLAGAHIKGPCMNCTKA